jgi:hypothetical protein
VARFDGKQLPALEWIGVLAGGAAVVDSFLSWRHVRGTGLVDLARAVGFRTWYTAWSSGLTAWLPLVLLAGAAALIMARGFGIRLPGVPFVWLGLAVAALILVLIRWLSLPDPDAATLAHFNLRPADVDTGASIGLYLGVIITVLSLAAAAFRVLLATRPEPTVSRPYEPGATPSGNG